MRFKCLISWSRNPCEPFATILSGTLSGPFGYKAQFGYYTDEETGLQVLTHRYYDPSTGRFLTRDPIGYEGGINLYAYTANQATSAIDPSAYSGSSWALIPVHRGHRFRNHRGQ